MVCPAYQTSPVDFSLRPSRPPFPSSRLQRGQQMAEIYPPYNDYQARTKREIPVVILEPVQ